MVDAEAPHELASNLNLDILQIVKIGQSQHGLRHGDHTRYRQYCKRRLARMYKALKFSHGRGKYQKRSPGSRVKEIELKRERRKERGPGRMGR